MSEPTRRLTTTGRVVLMRMTRCCPLVAAGVPPSGTLSGRSVSDVYSICGLAAAVAVVWPRLIPLDPLYAIAAIGEVVDGYDLAKRTSDGRGEWLAVRRLEGLIKDARPPGRRPS